MKTHIYQCIFFLATLTLYLDLSTAPAEADKPPLRHAVVVDDTCERDVITADADGSTLCNECKCPVSPGDVVIARCWGLASDPCTLWSCMVETAAGGLAYRSCVGGP